MVLDSVGDYDFHAVLDNWTESYSHKVNLVKQQARDLAVPRYVLLGT